MSHSSIFQYQPCQLKIRYQFLIGSKNSYQLWKKNSTLHPYLYLYLSLDARYCIPFSFDRSSFLELNFTLDTVFQKQTFMVCEAHFIHVTKEKRM